MTAVPDYSRRHAFATGRSCLLLSLLFLAVLPLAAVAEQFRWGPGDMAVSMGSGKLSSDSLIITADKTGRAFVSVALPGLSLPQYPLVEIEFAGEKPLTRMVLVWREVGADQPRQLDLPANTRNPIEVSMEKASQWQGSGQMLGLGVYLPPGQSFALRSISIASPTLFTAFEDALADWSHFTTWRGLDINLHSGTREFNQGLSPVLFFGLLMLAVGALVVILLRASGRGTLTWPALGVVVLLCWVALDAFWQWRLVQQVQVTHKTFAGKTTWEKLQSSSDRPWAQLGRAVKEVVGSPQGKRIFVVSTHDMSGMLGAYYIAPLNSYWHRKGPELPPAADLRAGDYVLLVRPSSVRHDPEQGLLLLEGGQVPVEQLLQDQMGLLLRVR